MDTALVAGRLLLAAVFVTAALSKVRDRAEFQRAVADFGVPSRLAPLLGTVIPLIELCVAVALVPSASALVGAGGALVLLVVFCAAIAFALARGKRPNCRCFGQVHSSPVGWRTLSRNSTLALVAILILWQGWEDPGPTATEWIGGLNSGAVTVGIGVLTLTVLAAQSWFLVHLLRQHGRMLVRLDALESSTGAAEHGSSATQVRKGLGLPIGAPAPDFALKGLHGETMTLEALRAGGSPVMLLFTDPNCSPCTALMPDIGRWQKEYGGRVNIAVLSRGDAALNLQKAEEAEVHSVFLQEGFEVADAYQFGGTPSAVIVGVDGRIQSPVAAGAANIRALVAGTMAAPRIPVRAEGTDGDGRHHHERPGTLELGGPAPELHLPDRHGNIVELRALVGRPTVVLFWDPACGFCQRMLPNLKAWEASATPDGAQLLVVSRGSAETNAKMELSSTVVVDDGASAMRRFGANGTPMAVLVDAAGRIASPLRAGQEEVLALLAPAEEDVSATAT